MIDTKKKTEIICPHGAMTAIAKELGVARTTVVYACRGVWETEISAKVRDLALNKYGGNYRRG